MAPWSFSWLPSLPSIDLSLPSGIQKRFISFALRQSLGHFLKPGQLDVQQVDSQIGSGYVQVRDLELNDEAINSLISGLPIRLRDGSVGKVTARIPLPNPLTSSVGVSLESLHLTFYLEPSVAKHGVRPFTDNLAESVAFVAESFIHEELSPREEATLRESVHPDLVRSDISEFEENVPGGLDPFMSEDELHQHDAEPPGVSIFATLIERLLARFQFDATDTRITIVNPQDASFTLIVPEIRYGTESQVATPTTSGGGTSVPDEKVSLGEVRKVIISGATVTTRCLRPLSPLSLAVPTTTSPAAEPTTTESSEPATTKSSEPTSPATTTAQDSPVSVKQDLSYNYVHSPDDLPPSDSPPPPEPSSPYSDSESDMDEETQMFMSQSIAVLPPRPISPASSVASSMYQSAISTSAPDPGLEDIPEEAPPSRSRTPSPPVHMEASCALEPPPEAELPTESEVPPEPSCPSSMETNALPGSSPTLSDTPAPSHFLRRLELRTGDIEDQTVLSLGIEPIEIRLTTPPPRASSKAQPASSVVPSNLAQDPEGVNPDASATTQDRARVDLTMGTIACALHARHIRSIINIAEAWSSHSPTPSKPQTSQHEASSSPFPFEDFEGALHIRGIVLLMLSPQQALTSNPDDPLTEFFTRPLVPPRLPGGYLRLQVEGISSSLSVQSEAGLQRRRKPSHPESSSLSASLAVSDISAFVFLPPLVTGADMTASPVFITDPYLPSQYPLTHIHPSLDSTLEQSTSLPTFDIIDWTDPSQSNSTAKLSLWRTKPNASGRSSSQTARHDDDRLGTSSSPSARPFPVVLPSSPGRLGLAGLSSSPAKGAHTVPKPALPAITVKYRPHSSRPGQLHDVPESAGVQVNLAPIHIFLDVGAALQPVLDGKSGALQFLEELAGPGNAQPTADVSTSEDVSHEADSDEEDSRPGTPKPSTLRGLREEDSERERRRLEQLVLDDLDLGYDYRKPTVQPQITPKSRRSKRKPRSKGSGMAISVNFPAIRVEIRVPPPPQRQPRSGAVILDIHGLCLTPGRNPERGGVPTARFGPTDDPFGAEPSIRSRPNDNVILGATWKRVIVAHSLVGETKARAILSLGPLNLQDNTQESLFGVGTPPSHDLPVNRLQPQVVVSRAAVAPHMTSSVSSVAISLDIPSVHVELSKALFDGLQFWADDLAQLTEIAFAERPDSDADTQRAGSADSSMIGSRYFARTNTSSSAPDSGVTSLAGTIKAQQEPRSETAVKVMVTEAVIRLWVPREEDERPSVRPFDVSASDIDVLLELKPEGKDETVVTVGVSDINVHDHTPTDRNCFLSLTCPRSLSTTTKSALKLRFTSLVVPETTAKESRVRLTLCGVTYHFYPDLKWGRDLGRFFKAPPGAFESVVPSERTRVNVKVVDTSIRLLAPSHPGAVVPYIGELDFSTVIEGNSPTSTMNLSIPALALLLVDDVSGSHDESDTPVRVDLGKQGVGFWKSVGYALVVEVNNLVLSLKRIDSVSPSDSRLLVEQGDLRLHMCADTMGALGAFIGDLSSAFQSPAPQDPPEIKRRNEPANVTEKPKQARNMLSSLDDHAFRRLPEVGAAPDMIEDDLPTNLDYLDESFGAAAGLRELSDDEFEESPIEGSYTPSGAEDPRGVTSMFGGETVRMLRTEGLTIVENYFETLPPDSGDSSYGETTFRTRIHDFNVTVFLYDGYDWARTRRIIEEKAKEMRRKLAKIRQLVASGQTPDPSVEETNALLFNSVYIGLEHNVDELEPGALIAAIDEELNEEFETNTQSSWQSLKPQPLASPGRSSSRSGKAHRRRLRRAKGPSIEFRLEGVDAEVDNYREDEALVSRTLVTVKDVEILDHIKTSTWQKFLTSLQRDTRGNVRESDSNMVRVELRTLHPVPGHPSEEARLRAKILPLRLHVDQDALDFLKQFFSFKDPEAAPAAPSDPSAGIYLQHAEVFPIDIKLDYKPRRVDYRALKEGRTIELMNFFHFDGAEMTLRHITVNGITGWPRFFDLLNDLWTPDVKATQLVEVISGVAPIRSVVNVGSGVADLVLLPIAQYKKDGRVVRGLQKGANSFVKSTAMEAIRLGARLATGTQVILEQAETVLGGQFKDQVTAEALQLPPGFEIDDEALDDDAGDLFSKYADQPTNVKEGVKSAYKSLKRNLNSAAQTILAVPMEVYERSGNEGPVRAVVRAVPIAVLKPMIGASEAVSKTLLGLQNTLDPHIRQENEAKYKQR
ncbi:hypothetical protein C2E23DRAFT_754086 [Lenzites betulinus]|nr:hypothetical protein C2E23DRAFT_754086 [Lenzites betulinus]